MKSRRASSQRLSRIVFSGPSFGLHCTRKSLNSQTERALTAALSSSRYCDLSPAVNIRDSYKIRVELICEPADFLASASPAGLIGSKIALVELTFPSDIDEDTVFGPLSVATGPEIDSNDVLP